MKVEDLIVYLKDCNPRSEVVIQDGEYLDYDSVTGLETNVLLLKIANPHSDQTTLINPEDYKTMWSAWKYTTDKVLSVVLKTG